MRSFAGLHESDDMQADTFSIVARHVERISFAMIERDPELLLCEMEALYSLIHMRMKDSEKITADLEDIKNSLYGGEITDPHDLSGVFDRLVTIWRSITSALDKEGILFRVRVDPDTMITR